ncbi:excinuclease ABC subunit C [Candidatus Acetothermia bacterium]|nr:MAG: excinuclease ABC subunit C [Candidatus Acetothermia bacterium]
MTNSDRLAERLAQLPAAPGVYLMRDARGKVIYVGKAAVLRNRVRSYFHAPSGLSEKTRRLVAEIADLEVIQTATEAEAFLLEDALIKKYQPRFNIRLRDDKRYPYLKITAEPFPRVMIVRRRARDGARYFGPYTNAKAMRATLKLAQKLFPIRTCNLALPLKNPRRPCLNYHIGRCLAPCAGLVSQEEYGRAVDGAAMLFEGRISGLVQSLRARMRDAADREQFELAARLRDQIFALNRALERQSVALPDTVDRDVIGIAIDGESACAQVFFVRGGRLSGRETFHLRAPGTPTKAEVLSAFLSQYYAAAAVVPKEVLLPVAPDDAAEIADWLSSLRGNKVRLKVPQRGEKRRLVALACDNARYSLKREGAAAALVGEETSDALAELAEALSLSAFPQRIEAFDISNTQGGEATGSMVVFEDGRPRRDAYRRFKVHLAGKPDDYAMMREVLLRRFRRGLAELHDPTVSHGKFSQFPDLLLIDGGKGQLAVALSVLKELELDGIEAIGLAKRHEEIYRPGESAPLRLPPESKALLLLRHIRDEAHRFAITYHRKLRGKRSLASVLDEIPGIGPKRRKALIKAFGSLEKLKQASVDEIAELPEIPKSLAALISASLKRS